MPKVFAWRVLSPIPLIGVLLSSCSVLYDLSTDQCSTNAECVGRFGRGFVCEVGICQCDDDSCRGSGGTSTGGKGGTDPVGESGSTSIGGEAGEGGTSSNGGSSGTGANAGTGGTPPAVECETHKECFGLYEDSAENPRACVEGSCVPLITPECPAVLPLSDNGKWNLMKSTNAIILGAFAPFINENTMTTFGDNYDLAVTELSDTTQGVYAGSSANRRQVMVVLCNTFADTQDELLVPAKHLMEELKVPGVVSALLLNDQRYVWENVGRDSGALMMMPLYSDQTLIDEKDDGRIWHMLSGAKALSVSYQPLLDMTEQHIRALGNLSTADDLKVAHVEARDEPFLQDTGRFIDENLSFNGQSATDNLNDSLYEAIEVTSAYTAPSDDQQAAIDRILAFGPHVVIGTTASEMLTKIIPGVEAGWAAQHPTQARPFYLLGALVYNDSAMAPLVDGDVTPTGQKPLYQRILGVNWPAAVDQSVYEAYQARWKKKYGKRVDGYENFYDAMYYLLYGVAAAPAPLIGQNIAFGLTRVTAHGSKIPQVEIGPNDDMLTYTGRLANESSAKIELIGAMGPPNWDAFGGRNDAGSVWCVNTLGIFRPDQLRYDPDNSALEPSDDTLPSSTISCFDFPKE